MIPFNSIIRVNLRFIIFSTYQKKLESVEFLARRFKLAGGNIKNIIVNVAILAAENSGVIAMKDVINATKRGFQKIGKVFAI